MEHPILLLVWLANKLGFGEFAEAHPQVIYSWFIAIILIIIGRIATLNIKLVPSGVQNFFEWVIDGIENFMVSVMGERGRKFFPLIATLWIFVLCCNYQGVIPGSFAPTANLNTTLAFALVIFFTTHIVGIKVHGFSYIKQFMGPVPWLVPLMLPVEILSHISRVLSLTLRLFGNIMGEDLVVTVLIMLAGQYLVPLPMMALGLFTGFLQSFIISVLAMLYISEAMSESH